MRRDLEDGDRLARADVDRQVVGAGLLEHQHQAVDDVVDRHEVAELAAVLEDHRLLAVEQPAQPDRGDARVRDCSDSGAGRRR